MASEEAGTLELGDAEPSATIKQIKKLMERRELKEVRSELDKLLKREPQNRQALCLANELNRAQGKRQAALEIAKSLIRFYPDRPEGYVLTVQDLVALKNFDQAAIYLDRLRQDHADDINVLRTSRELEHVLGNRKAAFQIAEQLIAKRPHKAEGYLMAARDLSVMGDNERAKGFLRQSRLLLKEKADKDSRYIGTVIQVYGILGAAKILSPIPHNKPVTKSGEGGALSNRKFVFVSGTPRSGTTALGHLLNLSDDVAMFTELHGSKLPYNQASFRKSFIDVTLETHRRKKVNAETREKIKNATYIGDKRPALYSRLEHTLDLLKDETVVVYHVVRSLPEVCQSYQARADNPDDRTWSVRRDHKEAIYEFNRMCRYFVERGSGGIYPNHKIVFAPYKEVFTTFDLAMELFDFLELSDREALTEKVRVFIAKSSAIAAKERSVSSEIMASIEALGDLDAIRGYEELTGCRCL